ncbi:scavenger receptor class F member 1 [Astyanax mexicanus]|uniref:scavenger receptor class F member 1 n=1 Tax=Astyanax mexicanus TaxID=7994 RepID=UPI0020CAE4CD|nr:scavenger receptor class F member 1 [Astyanax mexicanus]
MEQLGRVLTCLGLLLLCSLASAQKLSPTGKNVCLSPRDSSLVCCSGWAQQGEECTIPLCEGERSCTQDEVCAFPGVCRCKPGFFGFQCKTRCPPEFWGSDCRELCRCHPHGHCDAATGKCTCLPTRWGNLCQNNCKCSRHGRCDPVYGNCTCEEGWWTSTCSKACQCHQGTSTCDQTTGRCLCKVGYYGLKCSLPCNCNLSPCLQQSGDCQCVKGWWGRNCDRRCICDLSHGDCEQYSGECQCEAGYKRPFCRETCSAGFYGRGCTESCGKCEGGKPCSKLDGACDGCAPGWNGTLCDQPCPPGYYGKLCQNVCPRCRRGEPCHIETGECSHCDPGWTGPRCSQPCPEGTFGDSCRFLCSPCYHGRCDHVTGNCVCHSGFQGVRCNSSCPDRLYGINCSLACDCGDDVCHPATGACPYSSRAALLTGLLIPLLLIILALLFCCCCCGSPADGKHRVAVGDGSTTGRMKHHVYTVLANMSAAMPCLTFWSSGLPRVTVSHHDPELTFNHSFIEPPSSGWVTDSFETDEDGEALYCLPPREDIPAVAGGEFQELSSKCNVFPDPSAFSTEDMSLAFGIPRTSSIAKSKRPSVSFAEGTKFSPKERRGSGQELPANARKPKSPWGVLMLSALQGGNQGQVEGEKEEGTDEGNASTEDQESGLPPEASETEPALRTHLTVPGSRRRTLSNTKKHLQPQASSDGQEADKEADKVTTVYMTVGKAAHVVKSESSSEGPVQAMLRRLGSLQRQREEANRPKGKNPAVTKPPRRKLGARASVWEQAAGGSTSEVVMKKPSRKKRNSAGETETPRENSATKRPLSSSLMSVPESPLRESRVSTDPSATSEQDTQLDAGYETVAPSEEASTQSEVIINETLAVQEDGPNYENVYIYPS